MNPRTSGGATSSRPGRDPAETSSREGMAHFSTILLVEQTKGLNARIEFSKRLETNYARNRHPDSERPLVKIDGGRRPATRP